MSKPSSAACAAVVVLLGVGFVLGAAPACDDANSHIFSAQLYEQTTDCLDDYKALDIVTGGTGSASCDPVCLVGSGATYVSAMCPPYSSGVTLGDATDPTCIAALDAYRTCKWCMNTGNEPTCTYDAGGGDGSADDATTITDASDASDTSDAVGDAAADASDDGSGDEPDAMDDAGM